MMAWITHGAGRTIGRPNGQGHCDARNPKGDLHEDTGIYSYDNAAHQAEARPLALARGRISTREAIQHRQHQQGQ